MPTYLPFDPNPRRPVKTPPPQNASTASFTCWVRWTNIRCARAPPTRCRPRPGKRRCACTRRSASSAASSCRPRPTAPTTPSCSTVSPRWGRTIAAAPTRWCSRKPNDAYLAKLHDAGVRGARFSFRQELGAVLSDADFARAIARIRELGWYVKIQPEKDGIVVQRRQIRESRRARADRPHGAARSRARQGRSEPAQDAGVARARAISG